MRSEQVLARETNKRNKNPLSDEGKQSREWPVQLEYTVRKTRERMENYPNFLSDANNFDCNLRTVHYNTICKKEPFWF